MEIYDQGATTGTDPRLVEHLIDILHERGYCNVFVADAEGASSRWLENRSVPVLADLIGYSFVTPNGNNYDVIDLGEGLVDAGFPQKSALRNSWLSVHWQTAHFRIVFSKNKTDPQHCFALGLQNLLGILPLRAKDYHYRHRLSQEEVAVGLLEHTQVHFAIIDAFNSNHGSLGGLHSTPLETLTFIAGNHLLLADWVAALKMSLDPYASRLNAAALRKLGLPKLYKFTGDLAPYPGWKNVPIHLRESTRKRNESILAQRLADAWLQQVNTEFFPFKNILDGQINGFLAPLGDDIDEHPMAIWGLVAMNYLLAGVHQFQEAWQIMYDKDRLYRRETNLNVDLSKFSATDFEEVEGYIAPFSAILKYTPPDRNGLRWRYLDESVLFEYTKIIPVPYGKFVERVDIARAVQMMYDNIGGARQTVKQDAQKRIVYQAERDIYLPQPNWMALFGGEYIDVDKIEVIRYEKTGQHIYWRTVHSANGSAEFDDGMVSFLEDPGGVKVVIVARQKFKLPIFWQVFNVDYLPKVKEALVSDSYVRFFSRTMANFEAAYEGRSPLVGKQYDINFGQEDTMTILPPEIDKLKGLLNMLSGLAEKWLNSTKQTDGQPGNWTEDEMGYRHFTPSADGNPATDALRQFFEELASAAKKDIKLLTNSKP